VDYQKELKEWYEHYEARYKKAVSLHIDEESRHYQAFKEIECRHVALYLVMELMQNLPKYLLQEDTEKRIKEVIMLILQQLFLGEVIVNEHRQKEYISRRIMLSREDTRSIEIYQAAENAIRRMDESTFAWKEDARFTAEFQADLFHIVQWMILAREMIVPVEKNKKGICA
jgi:hypothetical protein